MKNFKIANRITGWIVFLIAATVYLLTIEPTTSFWDCGEFIATAFKLEVGHPPGAPLFMIIARVFSIFAGDVSGVAKMVNAMSGLASAFTILFLFWTITHLTKKMFPANKELTTGQLIAVIGSGVVGALTYTFSDTFWFSAVEGEVYGLSSLFTAVVFWAILKWENIAHEKYSNRWLILIAYLMGLSIGVHLLNLLAIPAIVFVYYFKKYPVTRIGVIKTLIIAVAILASIMYLIIPGVIKIATGFELLFVNGFGLPFNSGNFFYILLLIGLIVWLIHYTHKKKKVLLNTIVLAFTVIMIGYSSFTMIVIRSLADTPMDENNPETVFNLLHYLNREQYGNRPLFKGQYYNAPVTDSEDPYTYRQKEGEYVKVYSLNSIYEFDERFTTIFPRMYSQTNADHAKEYKRWADVKGKKVTITGYNGEPEIRYVPTFGENLKFFFTYQLGHMYGRYFMWNFAGRQNDTQSHGELLNGNWITGIDFIDNKLIGPQENLPDHMKNAKSRNVYFMLPLLLGLFGFFFHMRRHFNDFIVVLLLFVLTGIAIVVYLNQYPLQPRERDYAYAGSFYAFAIWIGLGVMGIYQYLKKYTGDGKLVAAGITLAGLVLVPGIMAEQGWDDHNRSGKYAARDLAMNYLSSCDKDAVLITNGDNDTFPLWYVQEVEDYRTDVRVVNYMLSSGYWYVHQLGRKIYDSEPLRFKLTPEQYEKGRNQYIMYVDRGVEGHVELKDLIDFIASDDDRTKIPLTTGEKINYIPTKKLRLTVDSAKCVDNGIVPLEMAHLIVPYIEWEVRQNALYKNDLMLFDFLSSNNWERPLYFANPNSMEKVLDIDEYCHLEGNVYKFMPVKAKDFIPGLGGINSDKSYDIVVNKFKWGNLNDPSVTVDRESYRHARILKQNLLRIAQTLITEGKPDEAATVMDTCLYYFPYEKIHYDIIMMPFIEIYYDAGRQETANEEVRKMLKTCDEQLTYILALDPVFADAYYSTEIQQNMAILQRMTEVTLKNGEEELSVEVEAILMRHTEVMQ